jgi:SDR family mycofactocin-dependent oxidoreductase
MGKLDGRTVFITGVARGQGRSHAVRFASEGANVVGIDICADIATVPYGLATPADLAETERLVAQTGQRMLALTADVRDPDAVQAAVDDGVREFGHIDTAIVQAGICCIGGEFANDNAAWHDTIGVNLTGSFNAMEAVVPAILAGGRGGSIVITSSAAGLKAMMRARVATDRAYFSYTTSKFALVGLMRCYALSLAAENIRVNSLHPTGVDTPMIQGEAVQQYFARVSSMASFHNAMPVEAITAQDVSDAALWLCSDESRYVTGVALPVDAGCLMI